MCILYIIVVPTLPIYNTVYCCVHILSLRNTEQSFVQRSFKTSASYIDNLSIFYNCVRLCIRLCHCEHSSPIKSYHSPVFNNISKDLS